MKPLKHPARHYIYYLFSKRSYDAATILAVLEDLDLPVPPENHPDWRTDRELFREEIKQAQRNFSQSFPKGYNPHDLKHKPTADFLRKHRIYDLWANDSFVAKATDLLLSPHMRRMAEIMLLGPLDTPGIARRIRDQFGLTDAEVNGRVVQCFAHYYWNYDILSRDEWAFVLQWRAAQRQKRITNGDKVFLVGGNDVTDYTFALNLPRNAMGIAMTVFAATGQAEALKESVMFRSLRDTALLEFMKAAITIPRSGIGKSQAMQLLMSQVVSAQEQLDMRRGASAELMDELHKIETDYDRGKLATVHQLPVVRHNVIEADIVKEQA